MSMNAWKIFNAYFSPDNDSRLNTFDDMSRYVDIVWGIDLSRGTAEMLFREKERLDLVNTDGQWDHTLEQLKAELELIESL